MTQWKKARDKILIYWIAENSMKYPRLPKEKWDKKVILDSQVKEIQAFFAVHKNIRLTARTFGISRHTVKYHTDEKFKEKENTDSNIRKHNKYHSSPEYREHVKKLVVENQKSLRKRNPALMKYGVERQKERYATRPEVRNTIQKRNFLYHRKNSKKTALNYWINKPKKALTTSYLKHKKAIELMLKVEPLLILFR